MGHRAFSKPGRYRFSPLMRRGVRAERILSSLPPSIYGDRSRKPQVDKQRDPGKNSRDGSTPCIFPHTNQ